MRPLRGFAAAYQDRLHATGAAEALIALPALPAPTPPAAIRTIEARGVALAFENVRLVWDESRPPALDGLSFFVAPGEMLVLAGPSGAGKSSVIELLLGFVRPDRGAHFAQRSRHCRHRAAGPLETDRLDRPENRPCSRVLSAKTLPLPGPEATAAEVDEAARLARITDFTEALPRGLETVIGEGGFGLSGGQAQRVAIGRAFLKNAPLLLLDEPTAHLDPATGGRRAGQPETLGIGPYGGDGQPFRRRPRVWRTPARSAAGPGERGTGRGMTPLLRILALWRGRATLLLCGAAPLSGYAGRRFGADDGLGCDGGCPY